MAEQTPYELLGGEAGVRRLVETFYDHMEGDAQAQEIRAMHAKSLRGSREKLFLFLSGWLGGPDLYVKKYGHPRLRRRHLPFAINSRARDQWMQCMRAAMDDLAIEPGLKSQLLSAFQATADHMRNTDDYSHSDSLPLRSQ